MHRNDRVSGWRCFDSPPKVVAWINQIHHTFTRCISNLRQYLFAYIYLYSFFSIHRSQSPSEYLDFGNLQSRCWVLKSPKIRTGFTASELSLVLQPSRRASIPPSKLSSWSDSCDASCGHYWKEKQPKEKDILIAGLSWFPLKSRNVRKNSGQHPLHRLTWKVSHSAVCCWLGLGCTMSGGRGVSDSKKVKLLEIALGFKCSIIYTHDHEKTCIMFNAF